jgi:hypothetical protein
MDLTNVRVAIAGTCRDFYRLADDAGKCYMFAFMPAETLLMSQGKKRSRVCLPGVTALGMHKGMMLRLDFCAAII